MEDFTEFTLSFRLFQRPSFIEGMSRIFDSENALNSYNRNGSGEQADTEAIATDWIMTGNDLNKAMAHEQ